MSIHEWNQHVARQAAATHNPAITEAFLRAATPGHRARMVERRLKRWKSHRRVLARFQGVA